MSRKQLPAAPAHQLVLLDARRHVNWPAIKAACEYVWPELDWDAEHDMVSGYHAGHTVAYVLQPSGRDELLVSVNLGVPKSFRGKWHHQARADVPMNDGELFADIVRQGRTLWMKS